MDKIKVGDRVEAPRHGKGTVLAIVNDNAWVQTEVRDYPLTFDIKKLKLVPKPRSGVLVTNVTPFGFGNKAGTINWDVPAIELTADVRERVKDLL